ncbi:MAG TPA: hypothetical protein VEW64_10750 [Methyloceanibacter sp.]|jgi:hypothetical protein|nr:hypothetical protein [Methyloceanibacter sp.]
MRDICSDLRERAVRVRQRIESEDAQFKQALLQLKTEHDSRQDVLKAELQAVNKLLAFTAWQHNVRTALLVAIAGAATAELSVRNELGARMEVPN